MKIINNGERTRKKSWKRVDVGKSFAAVRESESGLWKMKNNVEANSPNSELILSAERERELE
jgi:hypothetical protein